MPHYSVYLETADDGRCMAHVLDLPGCIVRAPAREQALSRVPQAIGETLAWLRRHGEPAPAASENTIEFQIAGESTGFGPFDRRSAAALFPPDRESVAPEEMERYFCLWGYSRADLLALVQDLPDDVLDWQPEPQSLSIRRLLRHVGNAEEWYVSRIVDADTLPPEWDHDEDLPILEFLEMERRTAMARLRQLTEAERTEVFHPTGWTDHPEEPWTARKALRRFLEHEREHTAQAREILGAWRAHQLAHLAAERAGLLWQAAALDEGALTGSPVCDHWTAKDLLAHVAAWDEMFAGCIELVLAGREDEIESVDLDADNARWHAERAGWPVAQAVEACVTARAGFLAAVTRLPDEEFYRLRRVPWGETSVCQWTQWRAWHDAAHAGEVADWREERGLARVSGPKPVLAAALDAARQELLTAATLVPPEERASRQVCGVWTTKDVLGHIADWEWVGVEGLRQMAAGQAPLVEHIADIEAWNQAHYEVRRDQPWEEVWADLHAAREALLEVLNGMGQDALSQSHLFPWGQQGTAHRWASVFVEHDRSHARDLRG